MTKKRNLSDDLIELGLILGVLWLGLEFLKQYSCPTCRQPVSKLLKRCPNCGRDLIW